MDIRISFPYFTISGIEDRVRICPNDVVYGESYAPEREMREIREEGRNLD